MKKHPTGMLYDHTFGDMPASDRRRIDEHLAQCPKCRADRDLVRTAAGALTRPGEGISPSDEREGAFWSSFAATVEQRIRTGQPGRFSPLRSRADQFLSTLTFHRGELFACAGVLALFAAATLLFWPHSAPQSLRLGNAGPAGRSTEPVAVRMNDYFRKSKVLFVGLTNMKVDDGQPMDLSKERKRSRELVHEARYLRQQPLDARSARLIGDLEKILIELANLEEEVPNVEIIRTGIRGENLLFKIRMAESIMEEGDHERGTQ